MAIFVVSALVFALHSLHKGHIRTETGGTTMIRYAVIWASVTAAFILAILLTALVGPITIFALCGLALAALATRELVCLYCGTVYAGATPLLGPRAQAGSICPRPGNGPLWNAVPWLTRV